MIFINMKKKKLLGLFPPTDQTPFSWINYATSLHIPIPQCLNDATEHLKDYENIRSHPPSLNATSIALNADHEPQLCKGKNSRREVELWVKHQAKKHYSPGCSAKELAGIIFKIACRNGFESERKPLSVPSIIKMIPAGVTGGRGRPKFNWHAD